MARNIHTLCSERHYMGSAASGRFATERPNTPPRYDRRPDAKQRFQNLVCRKAYQARYLREQNAVQLCLTCHEAKEQIRAGQLRQELLEAALAQAGAVGDAQRVSQLEEARTQLAEFLDDTLQRRRRASQQLRALGVSPRQEAAIVAEARKRAEAQAR